MPSHRTGGWDHASSFGFQDNSQRPNYGDTKRPGREAPAAIIHDGGGPWVGGCPGQNGLLTGIESVMADGSRDRPNLYDF